MSKITQMYDKWLKAEHLRGPVLARVTMAEIAQFDNKNGSAKSEQTCYNGVG